MRQGLSRLRLLAREQQMHGFSGFLLVQTKHESTHNLEGFTRGRGRGVDDAGEVAPPHPHVDIPRNEHAVAVLRAASVRTFAIFDSSVADFE